MFSSPPLPPLPHTHTTSPLNVQFAEAVEDGDRDSSRTRWPPARDDMSSGSGGSQRVAGDSDAGGILDVAATTEGDVLEYRHRSRMTGLGKFDDSRRGVHFV